MLRHGHVPSRHLGYIFLLGEIASFSYPFEKCSSRIWFTVAPGKPAAQGVGTIPDNQVVSVEQLLPVFGLPRSQAAFSVPNVCPLIE